MSTTTTQTSTSLPLSTSSSTPQQQQQQEPTRVSSTLNFFTAPADGSKAYNYVEEPPAGVPRNNYGVDPRTVTISSLRNLESSFSLDKNAFLAVPASNPISASSKADFTSDATVRSTYYPEVERLLLSTLPGHPKRVLIFDHTIRRAIPGAHREPVMRVHIDQTPASAAARVRHHLPAEEAEELLKGRYRLVNVWRPLNGAVESSPLAVADSATVPKDAVIGVDHIYPDRTGETAGVKFDGGMKWWFWEGMENEERLLLQCFDSESGTRVPHTAFKLPGQEEEGRKQRESIEVRALIFG